MRRSMLFVAIAFLQVSFFWGSIAVDYQFARAAEAADSRDANNQGTSHDDGGMASGEFRTSQDEEKSSSGNGASPPTSQHIPGFELLRYPYPASVDGLNKDATYQRDGKKYKFYEQNQDQLVFICLDDNSMASYTTVDEFQVVDDPYAQVVQDIAFVPGVQTKARELLIQTDTHLEKLQDTVRAFESAATAISNESNEESVRTAFVQMENLSSLIRREADALMAIYAATEDVLRDGVRRCGDLEERAQGLTEGPELTRKIQSLSTNLQNEIAAVGVESSECARAVKDAEEKIKSTRQTLKLVSDLREVKERLGGFLNEIASKENIWKSTLDGIRAITSKVTSSQEVRHREMSAEELTAAVQNFQDRVRNIASETGNILQVCGSVSPLKELCASQVGGDSLLLSEEIKAFKNWAETVESRAQGMQRLSQDIQGSLGELKDFAESYKVMDSSRLHEGLEQVKQAIQEAETKFQANTTPDLKLAQEHFSNALQSLMDAVSHSDLSLLESRLEEALQKHKTLKEAASAVRSATAEQLPVLEQLESRLAALARFVTSTEEKNLLDAAQAHVSNCRTRCRAQMVLADPMTVSERMEAAVQRALRVPLDAAESRISEGEREGQQSQPLLAAPSRDPSAGTSLRDFLHSLQENLQLVAQAFEVYLNCRNSEGVQQLQATLSPDGGGFGQALDKRLVELEKRVKDLEVTKTQLQEVVENEEKNQTRENLATSVSGLLRNTRPHVERLVNLHSEVGSSQADLESLQAIEDSLEALEEVLTSTRASGFMSRVQTLLESTMKATLTATAEHLQTVATQCEKAGEILSHGNHAPEPEDLEKALQEGVTATGEIMPRLSSANEALQIYNAVQHLAIVSSLLRTVPFSASGVEAESLTDAASILTASERRWTERVQALYGDTLKLQETLKKLLDGFMAEVLQNLDAYMNRLKSKEGLFTDEEQKERIKSQRQLYETARSTLAACVSTTGLHVSDMKECIQNFLDTLLDVAEAAVERAQDLQEQAEEELNARSATDVQRLAEVDKTCSRALAEAEACHEALELYSSSSSPTVWLKGPGVSLKEKAKTIESKVAGIVSHVNGIRSKAQSRSAAAGGMLQAGISQVLVAARRGCDQVQTLPDVDTGMQQRLVQRVEELEHMLASALSAADTPAEGSDTEKAIVEMVNELGSLAKKELEAAKRETTEAEASEGRQATAEAPSLLLQEQTVKTLCQSLPSRIEFVRTLLTMLLEISKVECFRAVRGQEEYQQLLTALGPLEERLQQLCEKASQQHNAAVDVAKQKFKRLKKVVEEALVPASRTLRDEGDPEQTGTHITRHITSIDDVLLPQATTAVLAKVEETRLSTSHLIVDVVQVLQRLCDEYLSDASALVDETTPCLYLRDSSRHIEMNVYNSVQRCQKLSEVSRALLKAYRTLYGDLSGGQQEHLPGAARSTQGAFTVVQKASFFECAAKDEEQAVKIHRMPQLLTTKLRMLRRAALELVEGITHTAEEALARLAAEDATNVIPGPTCREGKARLAEIKNVLEDCVSHLKSPVCKVGTEEHAEAVRSCVAKVLTSLLNTSEMHVKAARNKTSPDPTCAAGSPTSEDVPHPSDVERAIQEAQEENRIKRHAEAAVAWLQLFSACTEQEDVAEVASQTTGGPQSLALAEWNRRLTKDVQTLEEMVQQTEDQAGISSAALTNVLESRLEPLMKALRRGTEKAEDMMGDVSDPEVVQQGQGLKEILEQAVKGIEEIETQAEQGASPTENEQRVAQVLRMLVTHASNLADECIGHEQTVLACLAGSAECLDSAPGSDGSMAAAGALDRFVACTNVLSVTLDIASGCMASGFTVTVAQRTPWKESDSTSPSVLQHVGHLWVQAEHFETRIPVLAAEIRSHRGRGSFQASLAQMVMLLSAGFESMREIDVVDQNTVQQRKEELESLLEMVRGLQGAAVDEASLARVRRAFRSTVAEARRLVEEAKENLQEAENIIDSTDLSLISLHSMETMESTAEKSIEDGQKRATAARLLLAVVDSETEANGDVRSVVEKVASTEELTTATQLLEEAETCRARTHQLREKLLETERSASQLAAASLESLISGLKDIIREFEDVAVTYDCEEVVMPFTTRLLAMVGLSEVLQSRWSFPVSLSEYVTLMKACASECLQIAANQVATAEILHTSGKQHLAVAHPPARRGEGSVDEVARHFFEQARTVMRIASIALDGVWYVLTAGEVKRPDGRVSTVSLDSAVRDQFVNEAVSLSESMARLRDQLQTGDLQSIIETQQQLLVDLARDRVNHLIDSLQAVIQRLEERLHRVSHRTAHAMELRGEVEKYKDLLHGLTMYRDGPDFPGTTTQLLEHIRRALTMCVENAESHLDDAQISMTKAKEGFQRLDMPDSARNRRYMILHTSTQTQSAAEALLFAAMSLDTFNLFTHAMMVARVAETTSDTSDGMSLQQKAEILREQLQQVETAIREMRRQLAEVDEEGAASVEETLLSVDGVSPHDNDAEKIQKHFEKAEEHLQTAQSRVSIIKRTITDKRLSEEILDSAGSISSITGPLYDYLMGPVELAKRQLDCLHAGNVEKGAIPEQSDSALPRGGHDEDDDTEGREAEAERVAAHPATGAAVILSPSVCARLQLLDPGSRLLRRAEELAAATTKAADEATQTHADGRALLVLKQLTQILSKLVNVVEEKIEQGSCGEGTLASSFKHDCRRLKENALTTYDSFVPSGDTRTTIQFIEELIRKLLSNGDSLTDSATQVVGQTKDELRNLLASTAATPAGPEGKARVQRNVEVARLLLALTKQVVKSLNLLLNVALLLEPSGSGEMEPSDEGGSLTRFRSPVASVSEAVERCEADMQQLNELLAALKQNQGLMAADSNRRILADILQRTAGQLSRMSRETRNPSVKDATQNAESRVVGLARAAQNIIGNSPTSESFIVFSDIVRSAGLSLVRYSEEALRSAEETLTHLGAHTDDVDVDIWTSEFEVNWILHDYQKVRDNEMLAEIALHSLEAMLSKSIPRYILEDTHTANGLTVSSTGAVLKERLSSLKARSMQLRTHVFDMVYGTHRTAASQRNLLSHVISDVLKELDFAEMAFQTPPSRIHTVRSALLEVRRQLDSMGQVPQEDAVQEAAEKAVRLAVAFASEMAGEARQVVRRGEGQASNITREEAQHTIDIADLARAALNLAELPASETCFSKVAELALETEPLSPGADSTSRDARHTLGAETRRVREEVEEVRALAKGLLQEANRLKRQNRAVCKPVLQVVSQALSTGIRELEGAQQGSSETQQYQDECRNVLTEALMDMQGWNEPESLSELSPKVQQAFKNILDTVRHGVEDTETAINQVTDRDPDAERILQNASATGEIASAVLGTFHTCVDEPWIDLLLSTTLIDVDSEDNSKQLTFVYERGNQLSRRVRDAQNAIQEKRRHLSLLALDVNTVVEAVKAVVLFHRARLNQPVYQHFPDFVQRMQAQFQNILTLLELQSSEGNNEKARCIVSEVVRAVTEAKDTAAGGEVRRQTVQGVLHNAQQIRVRYVNSVNDLTRLARQFTSSTGELSLAQYASRFEEFMKAASSFDNDSEVLHTVEAQLQAERTYLERHCVTASFYTSLANNYLGVDGIGPILDVVAGEPSAEGTSRENASSLGASMLEVSDSLAKAKEQGGLVLLTKEELSVLIADSKDRTYQAIDRVILNSVDRLKALAGNMLTDEAHLNDKLKALLRLAANVVRKIKGESLLPPSGTGADTGLPNEGQMSLDDLFREVSSRNEDLQAALDTFFARIAELLSQVSNSVSFVQKRMDKEESLSAPRRRLAETGSGKAAALYELNSIIHVLLQLKDRVAEMQQQAKDAVREAARLFKRFQSKGNNETGSQVPMLALCIGIPLALLAAAGCMYYCLDRKKKKKVVSDITTLASTSDLRSDAQPCKTSQASRCELGEASSTITSVEPPELQGIRTLTSLETPDAGIPDTTQRQYMVDEHYVVATQMKDAARKTERRFDPPPV